jgi:hypothetical protein
LLTGFSTFHARCKKRIRCARATKMAVERYDEPREPLAAALMWSVEGFAELLYNRPLTAPKGTTL